MVKDSFASPTAKSSIRDILKVPSNILFINETINSHPEYSKRDLVRELCRYFSFIAPDGKAQLSSCSVVLNYLDKKGLILLPANKQAGSNKFTSMVTTDEEYPLAKNMPDTVENIKSEIDILLLGKKDSEKKIIWNNLIARDHPLKDQRASGYLVKYLICYQGYYIGAACFSSGSFFLEPRDNWIGWSKEGLKANRQKVISMSRFLIRNGIKCNNLASFLLSRLISRIKIDFPERYKKTPWLVESFIDTESYEGTCYQAANWIHVGNSKCRGRNDTEHEYSKTMKDVYLYVLEKNFREIGNLPPPPIAFPPLEIEAGLHSEQWADQEFGNIDLGDKRLSNRLVTIAKNKERSPLLSYANSACGDTAEIIQFYKFLGNKNKEVNSEAILSKHVFNTTCRMATQEIVLSIQDTCKVNYSSLVETKDLGYIGSKSENGIRGLAIHAKINITTDGIMLGTTDAPCWAPEIYEKSRNRDNLPVEEKETFRWIKSYLDDVERSKKLPDTKIIAIMDREGDFFELLKVADKNKKRVPIIVRAKHDRKIKDETATLFSTLENSVDVGLVEVMIPPQRSRKATKRKPGRPYIPERKATLKVSYKKVTIMVPENLEHFKYEPIELNAVYAREVNPPEGAERIEWKLLTTLEIKNVEDAIKCVGYYKLRWKIEEFFRVLKSGCKIEDYKLDSAEKLKRIIAISMIVAYKIQLLTCLARIKPELPAEKIFSPDELFVLNGESLKKNEFNIIKTVSQAIKVIAKMGGHQNRKGDLPPGAESLWAGLTKLAVQVRQYKNQKIYNQYLSEQMQLESSA